MRFNEGRSETFPLSSRCVSGGFCQMMTFFFPLSVFFFFLLFNSAAFHWNSRMCTAEQKRRRCCLYVLQVTKRSSINYLGRFCVFCFLNASSISIFVSSSPSVVARNAAVLWFGAGRALRCPSINRLILESVVLPMRENTPPFFPPWEILAIVHLLPHLHLRWFCWTSTLFFVFFWGLISTLSSLIFPATFCPTRTCATVTWPGWVSGWRRPGWSVETLAARNPPSWRRSPSRTWPRRTSRVTVSHCPAPVCVGTD